MCIGEVTVAHQTMKCGVGVASCIATIDRYMYYSIHIVLPEFRVGTCIDATAEFVG